MANASSFTPRLRLDLPGLAAYIDKWGTEHLNPDFVLIDDSADGVVEVDVATSANPRVLTVSADVTQDEARKRVLWISGTAPAPFTVRVPAGEKWRHVVNLTRAAVTYTDGVRALAVPPGVWTVNGSPAGLVLNTPTGGVDNVQAVAAPYAVSAADAGKVLVYYGAYAADLAAFAAAVAPGTVVTLRAQAAPVPVTYPDAFRGARSFTLPVYAHVRFAAMAGGKLTPVSWSPEALP